MWVVVSELLLYFPSRIWREQLDQQMILNWALQFHHRVSCDVYDDDGGGDDDVGVCGGGDAVYGGPRLGDGALLGILF